MSRTRRADVTHSSFTRCRSRSRKPTWRMSREELARVVAEHLGYYVQVGGWLYTKNGIIVCQGYAELGRRLESAGAIKVGTGVIWQQVNDR